jgi:hypothetical protein
LGSDSAMEEVEINPRMKECECDCVKMLGLF